MTFKKSRGGGTRRGYRVFAGRRAALRLTAKSARSGEQMEAGIRQGYFDRNGSTESDVDTSARRRQVSNWTSPIPREAGCRRFGLASRVQRRHVRQHDYGERRRRCRRSGDRGNRSQCA
eukprot:5063722-Prymnesium_polylepis.1